MRIRSGIANISQALRQCPEIEGALYMRRIVQGQTATFSGIVHAPILHRTLTQPDQPYTLWAVSRERYCHELRPERG